MQCVLRVLVRACTMREPPTGVAICHCMTGFQTELIPAACQILYYS